MYDYVEKMFYIVTDTKRGKFIQCELLNNIYIIYLYYIQVNPVTGEKQIHKPLDIEHVKRQNKNAPTIIGTSPKI
jgi:hypothetical protein